MRLVGTVDFVSHMQKVHRDGLSEAGTLRNFDAKSHIRRQCYVEDVTWGVTRDIYGDLFAEQSYV